VAPPGQQAAALLSLFGASRAFSSAQLVPFGRSTGRGAAAPGTAGGSPAR